MPDTDQLLRKQIRDEVTAIKPHDDLERRTIADALGWIDSGATLCRRAKPATPPRHLVSYFLLTDSDHILLVDHINAGLWLPSGGHVEPGEHPRETVQREILEELGIPAVFLSPAPLFLTVTNTVGNTPGHVDVSLWYLLSGNRQQALDFDRSEFRGVRWFHREKAPTDRCQPELGRFLQKLSTLEKDAAR